MSQNINQREMDAFLAWEIRNRENGITTWTVVEGSIEVKAQSMFASTAFWVGYGEMADVFHSVRADGDILNFVGCEDVEDGGGPQSMTRQEIIKQLVVFGDPEVQVCYPVTS